MNPYPARIDELHDWLARRYGQHDRQATEIALCALLPPIADAPARPWVIIETDWLNHDTADAWFDFGIDESYPDGVVRGTVRSMSAPRYMRWDKARTEILQEWIDRKAAGAHGLFVDPGWKVANVAHDGIERGSRGSIDYPGWRMRTAQAYQRLIAMSVRLRVDYPKSDRGVRPVNERFNDRAELRRLAARVLDMDHRSARTPPVICSIADGSIADADAGQTNMLYWCELLQRLAPLQTDWESLTSNVWSVATTISTLYGDDRAPDWQAAERVMRDTVPYMTRWIMERTTDSSIASADAARTVSAQGRTDASFAREIKRLTAGEVLRCKRAFRTGNPYVNHPARYEITNPDWRRLIDRKERILT